MLEQTPKPRARLSGHVIVYQRAAQFLGSLSRLAVILVLSCGSSVATPPPNATTAQLAVQVTTVAATVQPAGSISVELTNYAFNPADISVTSGRVVLYLMNSSNLPHAIALRNPAVSVLAVVALSETIEGGQAAVFTIENLPVGNYRMTCPVGHHADNGMVGTLVVKK
jgi:plastocyanin